MDLWFYVEVTPICHCNFFLFFYKNYYRSVKLDGRGTGHLWRMWVPMLITLKGNKELISFQKVNNVPLILRSPWLREARVCVRCIYVKARVTVVVCVGFTHIFLCFLTSPPPSTRPTFTRYRLSVPLFFYDFGRFTLQRCTYVREPQLCALINCNLYFDRRPMTSKRKRFYFRNFILISTFNSSI